MYRELEGKIIQAANLYLVQNSEARHIKTWEALQAYAKEKYPSVNTNKFGWQDKILLQIEKVNIPPEGKPITEWPEKEEPIPENPFREVRGLLTLKPLPSTQTAKELGFNLIQPFASLPYGWDGDVIPVTGEVLPDETYIRAYSITDEPDCHGWPNPQDMVEIYKRMKQRTDKPVGANFCGRDIGCGMWEKAGFPSNEAYKKAWIEVINQLDFFLPNTYVYMTNVPIGEEIKEMERCLNEEWKSIKVSALPVIQAHSTARFGMREPNPMEQVKFWISRGFGYIIYPWRDEESGVRDAQEEWKEANEWAASQTIGEVIK